MSTRGICNGIINFVEETMDTEKWTRRLWGGLNIACVILPWMVEAILVSQVESARYPIILGCGIAQIVFAVYGGLAGGWKVSCYHEDKDRQLNDVWLVDRHQPKALISPGYILQVLIPWFIANTTLNVLYKDTLGWKIQVVVWVPLGAYIFSFFLGIFFQALCK